jgi:hypothetical protein
MHTFINCIILCIMVLVTIIVVYSVITHDYCPYEDEEENV